MQTQQLSSSDPDISLSDDMSDVNSMGFPFLFSPDVLGFSVFRFNVLTLVIFLLLPLDVGFFTLGCCNLACSFFIAWFVNESMFDFFIKSPVTLYGGINFFFGLCTTFVICRSLKKFFIFSVLLFTGLGVSGGRSLIRDCVMAGTEFSDVAFGQSLLDSGLSDGPGFTSFVYIVDGAT